MKIDINFIGVEFFEMKHIHQWMWMFKRYTYVRGFQMRIFGIHFNVREKNATEKLIKIWQNRYMPS